MHINIVKLLHLEPVARSLYWNLNNGYINVGMGKYLIVIFSLTSNLLWGMSVDTRQFYETADTKARNMSVWALREEINPLQEAVCKGKRVINICR
jgi:hypothetical protein